MATISANLALTLPESYDKVDVSVLSNNFSLIDTAFDGMVSPDEVANNLTTTEAGKVLDARQGRELLGLIEKRLEISKIANNLTTNSQTQALSAAQGVALLQLINSLVKTSSVSLTVAGWTGSGPYTQTVNVANLTATTPVVCATPEYSSQQNYYLCNVGVSSQGAGKLTFKASTKPTVALTVNIFLIG